MVFMIKVLLRSCALTLRLRRVNEAHSQRNASVLWRYDGRITHQESGAAHQFCSTAAFVRAGHILLARSQAHRGMGASTLRLTR